MELVLYCDIYSMTPELVLWLNLSSLEGHVIFQYQGFLHVMSIIFKRNPDIS